MNPYPTDQLVSGMLKAALLTAALVFVSVYFGASLDAHYINRFFELGVPVLVSALILFPRPLLLRTLLRAKRDPFLLDEDLNLLLVGLAVGLVGGIFIGVTLCTEFF